MKKIKTLGLIVVNKNLNHSFNLQQKIYTEIKKKYKKFYIINLANFLIFKNKEALNPKLKLPRNIIYFEPKKIIELKEFIKNKNLIVFSSLGSRSLNHLNIYLIIKKLNIKQMLLFNLDHIGNDEIALPSFIFLLNKFKILFQSKTYDFLLFFKILPQIEIYFHTDKNLVNKINSINIGKSKKIGANFFNLSYIKKAVLIGIRKNNYQIKNKFISFIDSNFYHSDRMKREMKIEKKSEENYFKKLNFFLGSIKKRFNKKLIICLHPTSDERLYNKYLKNFNLIKHNTQKILSSSYLTFFHESSLILDSLNLKKPIVLLRSKYLGIYMSNRIEKYRGKYKLHLINIDLDYMKINNHIKKINITKLINKKINKTSNFNSSKIILDEIGKI